MTKVTREERVLAFVVAVVRFVHCKIMQNLFFAEFIFFNVTYLLACFIAIIKTSDASKKKIDQ